MSWILRVVLMLLLFAWLSRQVRKLGGLVGRSLLRTMNLSHAALTDWGLDQLAVGSTAAILDIGCGGGRTVHRLVALAPGGKVTGLDYSAASVAAREISMRMRSRLDKCALSWVRWPLYRSRIAPSTSLRRWRLIAIGPTCRPMSERF